MQDLFYQCNSKCTSCELGQKFVWHSNFCWWLVIRNSYLDSSHVTFISVQFVPTYFASISCQRDSVTRLKRAKNMLLFVICIREVYLWEDPVIREYGCEKFQLCLIEKKGLERIVEKCQCIFLWQPSCKWFNRIATGWYPIFSGWQKLSATYMATIVASAAKIS